MVQWQAGGRIQPPNSHDAPVLSIHNPIPILIKLTGWQIKLVAAEFISQRDRLPFILLPIAIDIKKHRSTGNQTIGYNPVVGDLIVSDGQLHPTEFSVKGFDRYRYRLVSIRENIVDGCHGKVYLSGSSRYREDATGEPDSIDR